MERDKFLTEVMGECWHESFTQLTESDFYEGEPLCTDCGKRFSDTPKPLNFSTWQGFGKLWEWAQEQEWFLFDFIEGHLLMPYSSIDIQIIHPDRFADALYEFLKGR